MTSGENKKCANLGPIRISEVANCGKRQPKMCRLCWVVIWLWVPVVSGKSRRQLPIQKREAGAVVSQVIFVGV